MSSDIDIIETKVALLKSEILEYKIYIEVCAVTILFMLLLFFGAGNNAFQLQTYFLGQLILVSLIVILFLMVYMFLRVIYLSKHSMRDTLKNKKMLLEDWTE